MKRRRTVLKGIGLSLPAAWTTPVILSVALPAHAQTSADHAQMSDEESSSGSAGCDALVIPGTTVSCPVASGSGNTANLTDYRIDDSGTCPELAPPETGTGAAAPGSDDVLRVVLFTGEGSDTVLINVLTSGGYEGRGLSCGALVPGDPVIGSLTFESTPGATTYQADFTITATIDGGGNFLTLSDITLTPL